MREKNRTYFCIDMKCFFASVECAERRLNPFETNLVVADESRGPGAICLAISPKMKSLGVKNRCRIYEIPKNIKYIIAKPRMKKYIQYAADIYEIYLNYISPDDIHVYSIDESFLDVTDYLKNYKMEPKQFANFLMDEIARKTLIPATAGIGTNLYLAKIALDITAKHAKDHIGYLDEKTFIETLSNHRPITDFWGIAAGTQNRLKHLGIFDMQGIRNCPVDILYKTFGINAELIIDHAYGKETCLMEDIKSYKTSSKSISTTQILFSDYTADKAYLVLSEMTLSLCQRLLSDHLAVKTVGIYVGYSKDVIPPTGGNMKMVETTNVYSIIVKYVKELFDKNVEENVPIRRLGIFFSNLVDENCEGYDIFTNYEEIKKEKSVEKTVIDLQSRFGKDAVLRASDLQEGATQKIRNKLIGGHNGG